MRLIDADALVKEIESTNIHISWEDVFPQEAKDSILSRVKKQPTIDAVPVVHGQWVSCGDGVNVPYMCSLCGKVARTNNYSFCPHYGARMDAAGESQ